MVLFGKRKEAPPPGLDLPPAQLAAMFKTLVRTDPDRPCPWCSQSLGASKDLCNFCGRPVPRPLCLNCRSPLVAGVQFCNRCGKRFEPVEVMRRALAGAPGR
ncbi:MAG: zinc ribbon domain-containing protein [Halobacteria archaeon]